MKGLTPIPPYWGSVPTNAISTVVDASRYEVKQETQNSSSDQPF